MNPAFSLAEILILHLKTTYFRPVVFTGIIETLGRVSKLQKEGENLRITIESELAKELKIDQSIAHNGVCLTVETVGENEYSVVAVAETLQKSNLGHLREGVEINLERAMVMGSRLDGHLVQGHVDGTATCTSIKDADGSWVFGFSHPQSADHITVEKGSITIDGVSLTVVNSSDDAFEVAIIPYTYENTLFKNYEVGSIVNLEFDVIGKYVAKLLALRS